MRSVTRRLLPLLLLPTLVGLAEAAARPGFPEPGYVERVWTRAEGLPTDEVFGVLQASDGYLWFGTQDGVVRFDGVRMRVFDAGNTEGLILNLLPYLAEDAGGRLVAWGAAPWVAIREGNDFRTYGTEVGLPRVGIAATLLADEEILVPGNRGLFRLVGDRYEPVHPDLADTPVADVRRRADGSLLVARGNGGLWRLAGGDLREIVPVPADLVVEGLDHTLWIAGSDGLVRVRDGVAVPEPVPGLVDAPTLLEVAPDGALWVGGPDGLYVRRPYDDAWTRVSGRPAGVVRFAGDGTVWAACGAEVFRDGVRVHTAPAGVNDLLQDREGNLWITTAGSGVVRLNRASVVTVSSELAVEAVAPDGAGGLWLASPSGTLRHLGANGGRDRSFDPWIRSVYHAPDGETYLGSWDGLFRLRGNEAERVVPFETSRQVYAVAGARNGDLWVSGFGIILRRHEGTWERFTVEDGISAGPTRVSGEGPDGEIWFATPEGALRFAEGAFRLFTEADGLSSNRIRAVLVDGRGVAWIGTEGRGIDRVTFDGAGEIADVVPMREADGLFENGITWLGEDPGERIWIATNRGVGWIPRAELDAFAAGERDRVFCRVFGEYQGMRRSVTASSGTPVAFLDDDGLIVATEAGVAHVPFDPPSVPVPPVRLESVVAAGRARPAEPGIELAPSERSFEIAYTALAFGAPEQVRFRYRLEGLQEEWTDAGARRTAYFTHVPQGRYTFRVQAAGADGRWGGTEAELPLVLVARPWETLWFRGLVALALLGLIAAGFQVRLRLARRREIALEHQVAQRTRELEHQATRLEELDRAKSRFFANVSHEFRTPLTLTIGPLEDLLAGLHGRLDPDAQREIRTALDSSRSVLDLVNQILDLAKLESGRFRLQAADIDLARTLRAVAAEFAPLSERREIPLEFVIPDDPVVVRADETLLRRVFVNLLSNAFKFTSAGGSVTLSLHRLAEDEGVEVRVIDSGVGIPEEERERIFDRFHQATGHDRAQPGTGIGLSLARELVELHHGSIAVESEVGRGTVFAVRLPLDPAVEESASGTGSGVEPIVPAGDSDPSGETAPAVPTEAVPPDRTTVLVAEDHPEVRALLRKHLAPRYRLLEAADGEAGLELARREIPDLILSDVMMPRLDGMQFCRAVKDDPAIGFIPVILLTARADVEDRVEGFDAGADAYVAKPFESKVLLAQVEGLIRERRRLKDHYAGTAPAPAAPVTARNRQDQAYVDAVAEVVVANLADEDFSVEVLADRLGQTRSTLFRRLKDAGGVTPSELIRTLRLERARQMLEEQAGSVNEVAYGVGFKSVSHFCTAFKQAYGATPGEWATRDPAPRS